MRWVHVHITGIVQGVGFRPFVFKLANWLQLKGWVRNDVDGVHIEAGGEKEQIEMFLYLLQDDAPAQSQITSFWCQDIESLTITDFQILESNPLGKPDLLITPDLGLCEECRQEIHDPENRRYHYPFTTCTHCGPRYSILRSLPYDRHTTSMEEFEMCLPCTREYHDPVNRRHFSQTNSCPDCTIPIRLISKRGKVISEAWPEILSLLLENLKSGKILAVKGIGGYLLMVDASNQKAIQLLRERKHRPTKPFALMYPDLDTLRKDAELDPRESAAFTSIQSPIVLVKPSSKPASGICLNQIAPGLNQIGVMQPYSALFELLLRAWGKPLVATSGNVSGSPILYEDHAAFEELADIADLFLMNDRTIEIAQDDSVVRFARNHRLLVRRSRGYAPTYFNQNRISDECILAMGADLKSAFAIQAHGKIYISQYLGDLESYESQQYYRRTIEHLINLLRVKPQRILIDAHPGYYSAELGIQLARQADIPVDKVYHHQAHAWSVLAENNLLQSTDPVLCVVWDGTGYGQDGQIWGGEFFVYHDNQVTRKAHVQYWPATTDDRLAREPRLSALIVCYDQPDAEVWLRPKFNDNEWNYFQKWLQSKPRLRMSSMGRLFDAVASLLGITDYNSFEGEAAMHLEALAETGICQERYSVLVDGDELKTDHLITQILSDLKNQEPNEKIAYKFHYYLADAIREIAQRNNLTKVALSGGVFQNRLLINLITENPDAQVYLPAELSSNDEGIALGQLMWASIQPESTEVVLDKELISA